MDGDKFDQSHRASERNPRLSSALRRGSHAPDMKSFSRAVLSCTKHIDARDCWAADTPQSVAWPVSPISFPTHSHQRTPSPICLAPKALSYYPHPFVSLPSRGQPLLSIPRELARKSCSGSPELIVQLFLYPPRSTQRILRHYPTSTGTCVIEFAKHGPPADAPLSDGLQSPAEECLDKAESDVLDSISNVPSLTSKSSVASTGRVKSDVVLKALMEAGVRLVMVSKTEMDGLVRERAGSWSNGAIAEV